MTYTFTGNLLDKGELFEGKNGFRKRKFRLTERIQLGEKLIFSTPEFIVMNDGVGSLDSIREGDKVEVTFYINGKEWKGDDGKVRNFTELVVNKIDLLKDEIESKVHKGSDKKVDAVPSDVRELETNFNDDNSLPL